jgi:transcriptional regulator with PAS, ATPase and Fis domain
MKPSNNFKVATCGGCTSEHVYLLDEDPDTGPPATQAELLQFLTDLRVMREGLETDEAFLVEFLRKSETPWQQMAKRLGIHKATLMRRYEFVA